MRKWLTKVYCKSKIEVILLFFLCLEVAYSPKFTKLVRALRIVVRLIDFSNIGGDYD